MLHKKCLNGMFIFRSLKNRLRVYANIWFTLLEKIKEHVFINGSPWYTGNANLSFYSLQFFYVLVLVLHVFLFLIYTVRLSCFLDFKVYRRCHLFYKKEWFDHIWSKFTIFEIHIYKFIFGIIIWTDYLNIFNWMLFWTKLCI